MRSLLATALAAFLAISPLTAPAKAAPLDESCALIGALASGGAKAGIDQLMRMAGNWAADDAAKLGPLVGPVLAKFQYSGGNVYSIANLGNSLHEHLVVMRLQTAGSVYLRLLYEGNGGEMSFINVDFQAKYHDILQKPVLQEPVLLSCQ